MARYYKLQQILLLLLLFGAICVIMILFFGNNNDENIITDLKDLEHFLNQVEEINKQRIDLLRKTCKKYNLGLYKKENSLYKLQPRVQYRNFYIDRIHDISLCPIYKSGSTTWIHNLCSLNNVPEEHLMSGMELMSTMARRVIPRLDYPEAEVAIRKTTKILNVRHPFERLLSAYRDKLENTLAGRENFQEEYGTIIVQNYRDPKNPVIRANQVIKMKDTPEPAGVEPTFREFIDYVINADLGRYHSDDHWIPYHQYCTPCSLNYDFINKVETLWQDQVFTLRKLKLNQKIKPHWRNSYGRSNASRIYYSQLNKAMIYKLYDKFKLDFEMFDYSPNAYFNYATSKF